MATAVAEKPTKASAKSTKNVAAETQPQESEQVAEIPERTDPVTVGPEAGGNSVLAAWRFLYHIFGARADGFDITHDGVIVRNLSFAGKWQSNPIVDDLYKRGEKTVSRRLDLIPAHFWAQGEVPEEYTLSDEMTGDMVQFFKGAGGDDSRSPDYAKTGIADYKRAHNIAAPRGRRRKILRIDALGDVKADTLAGVDVVELEKLKATIDQAMALAAQRNGNDESAEA